MMLRGAGAGLRLAAAALLGLVAVSCNTSTTEAAPVGSASVVSHYEATSSATGKVCVVTIKIENTGTTKINTSTVSVQAKTDAYTYYKTFSSSTDILAGGSIYKDLTFTYKSLAEALAADGLAIADQFYD